MRPLELQLRNFRSYAGGDTSFDFRDRRLVGVVGPIGSGKSSLLDAIAFALYGKTPTSGSNRKSLINQRSDHMAVKLRFAVDDEVWEVVRSLRRKGAAQHALYRFAADEPAPEPSVTDGSGPEIIEKITQDAAVNEKIVELLGLDYDAFGRSVMLAQNRFSEFLSAGAAQRDTVLKGVFGHDRIDLMRDRAKELLDETRSALEKVALRTEQLDAVAARLRDAEESRTMAAQRMATLTEARPRLEEIGKTLDECAAEVAVASTRLAELTEIEAGLPPQRQVEQLVTAAADAAAHRNRLADAMDRAGAELAATDTELGALVDAGEDAIIDKAAALVAQRTHQLTEIEGVRQQLHDLAGELGLMSKRQQELETALDDATSRTETATVAVGAATEALHLAREHLAMAQRSDMAHALRTTLEAGAACPVCEQTVVTLPGTMRSVALDEAQVAVEQASVRRTAAEEEKTAAIAESSRLTAALQSHSVKLDETRQRQATLETALEQRSRDLTSVTDELESLLGAGDPEVLLHDRRKRRADLVHVIQERKQALERVRREHEQTVREAQTVDRELSGLMTLLAATSGRLGEPITLDRDDPVQVADTAAALRSTLGGEIEQLRTRISSAESAQEAAVQARDALLDELGLDRPIAEEMASVEATLEHLDRDIARDKAEVAGAEQLLAEKAGHERQIEVYGRLVTDLKNSEFIRFLLDEERSRLAILGSAHFLRLSSGRYAFSEDGEFSIVDLTSADAVRKASSLSGGETFLASLALALALAEMVARTGGRLDAFFLDEGFGSLDPEHLDLAMEGIEALVADNQDRLVVVVSHVPELRHRIDDQIQLDRDGLTGDTRVVRG